MKFYEKIFVEWKSIGAQTNVTKVGPLIHKIVVRHFVSTWEEMF